jgi:cytochrome c oxidase subunit 2
MSSTPRTRFAPPGSIWAWLLVAIVVVGLALTVATGAVGALFPPEAATRQGREIRDLYTIVFAIAAVIFFIVEGLILWTVIRYRRKPGDDELPPQTHGNNLAEVAWTVIPTLIVAFLFVISWQTLNNVEAVSARPDLTVRVTGSQFAWTFDYLDEAGTPVAKQTVANGEGGILALPVGRSIQFRLHSVDVIHSFYVPAFLFKRDVNPDASGRENVFEFTIDPSFAGQVLRGQCAELCGLGHRKMLFEVHPMTDAGFAAWLEEAGQQPSPAPSGPVGTTLELTAKDIAYDTKEFEVPAGEPFAIDFINDDPAGVTHDVDIRLGDGTVVANTEPIDGGTTTTNVYGALEAGEYTFICSIHPVPAMTGTLTVK